MAQAGLNMSRRIRRTPFTDRVEAHGVRGFSVVNHMLLPKAFQPDVEDDYFHLRSNVQIWDVAVQRQVQITGQDAARLVQMMTPRDISAAVTGQCLYLPLIDQNAGMLNDPVLLKLGEDSFWLSIADLSAAGVASRSIRRKLGLPAMRWTSSTECAPELRSRMPISTFFTSSVVA